MFPDKNFYFFKIHKAPNFRGENLTDEALAECKKANEIERKELSRLIQDCMKVDRFYIEEGCLIEPIHLEEKERKQIIEGMWTSVVKIGEEVHKSNEFCLDTFHKVSP